MPCKKPFKRPKKLKDIKLSEVSFVDKPANMQNFVFFKNDEGIEFDKETKQVSIGIESDGTGKGTKVTINGKIVKSLTSFYFSMFGTGEYDMVECKYSKAVGDKDGFKRSETFHLSKGDMNMEKIKELLKAYFGEDIDIEKKVEKEKFEKALELVTETYQEDFPEDLEKAIGVIIKSACVPPVDVEKVGAKFSKEAMKKMQAVIDALNAIISGASKTEKALPEEVTKQLEILTKAVAEVTAEPPEKTEAEKTLEKMTKTMDDIQKRVEGIEKESPTSKSISTEDTKPDDDDNNTNEDDLGTHADGKKINAWPTLTNQG